MFEATAIDEAGVEMRCPHCAGALAKVLPHDMRILFEGYLYSEGDTLPISSRLDSEQRDGFGWNADLNAGVCPFCAKPIVGIIAQFLDTDPDAEFEDVYFFDNGDKGKPTNFLARQGQLAWFVSRYDTPLGPMLEHWFGPFPDRFGDWIGPNGVATCSGSPAWDFAVEFMLSRWDELRTMPKGLGLDPEDPLAHPRPLPLSAKSARAERQVVRESRVAAELDDDIPF